MTGSVNLAVGMYGIRRDGVRVGPAMKVDETTYHLSDASYNPNGKWTIRCESPHDIISAGYPWADLGAQVGDTVRLVWNGYYSRPDDIENVLVPGDFDSGMAHPNSLYVVVKRAQPAIFGTGEWTAPEGLYAGTLNLQVAKPDTTRPRAVHKLSLRDGDVVRLEAWQDDYDVWVGNTFIVGGSVWPMVLGWSRLPKGERPLFTVISRAPQTKPDEVIVRYCEPGATVAWYGVKYGDCTHRYTLTFPNGGDTGTVTRKRL